MTAFARLAGDHLWQSTLVAVAAWGLTQALRRNRAHVRGWIWLAASVKFLVPFAWLVALGSRIGWPASAPVQPRMMPVMAMTETFSQAVAYVPAAPPIEWWHAPSWLLLLLIAVWCAGSAVMVIAWFVRWRRIAAIVRDARPVDAGRELAALRRLEAAAGITRPTRLVQTDDSIEPGVFGIAAPVLVWPRHMSACLGADEMAAIVAHEVCHIRRRDNLAAALHTVVQSIYWFHPLVWWVGGQLLEERERACDEDVVGLGSAPHVYAESILKASRYCVELPAACAAGVTGSDLVRRIERIMTARTTARLTLWRKALIATTAGATLAAPLLVGALSAPVLRAQSAQIAADNPSFEVASIKPNASGDGRVFMQTQPGRFTATNVTLRLLIRNAYQLQDFQIAGGPSWMSSDHFDIVAKIEDGLDAPSGPRAPGEGPSTIQLMIRSLLADRFKLVVHNESKEQPIYALVVARSDGRLGPQLKKSETDCAAQMAAARGQGPGRGSPPPAPPQAAGSNPCGVRIGMGNMTVGGATLPQIANSLGIFVGRIVQDRTGLSGAYDFTLNWTPDQMPPRPAGAPPDQPMRVNGVDIDPNGPSIFTAVQEQLGLKLEPQRGPVTMLVIDRAEKPAEN
jgi:bla regulator protein blaR1